MASQGPNSPNTATYVANILDFTATLLWSDKTPGNVLTSNNVYVSTAASGGAFATFRDYTVQLTQTGDDKKDIVGDYAGTLNAYAQYGGSTDTWNALLSPTIVNQSTFGGIYAPAEYNSFGAYVATTNNYIYVTNFGFTVPLLATIKGVLFEIERHAAPVGRTGVVTCFVDHMRMTVYYESTFKPQIRMYMLAPLIVKAASLFTGLLRKIGIHEITQENGVLNVIRFQTRTPKVVNL